MGEITDWVKGIVLVIIFATFLEFLLPASNMQKFIRVIMGLFIMLSILNPIINVLQKQWLPEEVTVFRPSEESSANIKQAVNRAIKTRDEITLAQYRSDLARQIRAIVVALDGVAEAKVIVETENTAKGTLKGIQAVTVYVEPGTNKADRKVAMVTIGSSQEKQQPGEIPAHTVQKIRQVITELTGLGNRQIEIKGL